MKRPRERNCNKRGRADAGGRLQLPEPALTAPVHTATRSHRDSPPQRAVQQVVLKPKRVHKRNRLGAQRRQQAAAARAQRRGLCGCVLVWGSARARVSFTLVPCSFKLQGCSAWLKHTPDWQPSSSSGAPPGSSPRRPLVPRGRSKHQQSAMMPTPRFETHLTGSRLPPAPSTVLNAHSYHCTSIL